MGKIPSGATTPQVMANGRIGLLMRPVFMANSTSLTSPIIRGLRMRSRVLCLETPAPPGNATSQGPDVGTEEMMKMYSTRERVDLKTAGPVCLGCHAQINPVGHVFEGFDSFGRIRNTEVNYRADGSVIATHAVDTRVTVDLGSGPQSIAGPQDFVQMLSQGSLGPSCLVRQTFRYYHLQSESDLDNCMLADMHSALTGSQGSILQSLKKYVLSNLSSKRVK